MLFCFFFFFFFQAEDGIRDDLVTGVQTCALPILTNLASDPVEGTFEVASFATLGKVGTLKANADPAILLSPNFLSRSEERRVGKECRSRWWPEDEKKKNKKKCESRRMRKRMEL